MPTSFEWDGRKVYHLGAAVVLLAYSACVAFNVTFYSHRKMGWLAVAIAVALPALGCWRVTLRPRPGPGIVLLLLHVIVLVALALVAAANLLAGFADRYTI